MRVESRKKTALSGWYHSVDSPSLSDSRLSTDQIPDRFAQDFSKKIPTAANVRALSQSPAAEIATVGVQQKPGFLKKPGFTIVGSHGTQPVGFG